MAIDSPCDLPATPSVLPRSSFWSTSCAAWVKSSVWPIIGLILAVGIIYFPVTQFQLLNWDDNHYLTWNDLIKSWHPTNLYRVMTEPVTRNFAPLTIFSFLVEHTLWGLNPAGYHTTNMLLHMLNAVLVWQLLKQLTKNDWLSFGVAMLFAVHPVQIEAVAWISSRKTLLSATFMLASFISWLRPERTSRDEFWGVTWLLLGLLCKASVVIIPPVVVVYDVLVAKKKLSESVARQFVPMFFCIMLIFTTMHAQVTVIGGLRDHIGWSKFKLFAVDLTLLWRYVGMLLWPQDLCVLYSPPVDGIAGLVVAAAIGWTLVSYGLWTVRERAPLVSFAGIAALLVMIPMLNLFPLTTLMNDRFMYIPCIPFFAVIAWLLQQVWNRITALRPALKQFYDLAAGAVFLLAIGGAAWATLDYLPVFRNPETLWNYARHTTPSLPVVHIQWALTMEDAGRPQEGLDALHFALANCHPDQLDIDRIQVIIDRLSAEAAKTPATHN